MQHDFLFPFRFTVIGGGRLWLTHDSLGRRAADPVNRNLHIGHFMSNTLFWTINVQKDEEGHRLPPPMTVKRKGKRKSCCTLTYRIFSTAGYNGRLQWPVTMGSCNPVTISTLCLTSTLVWKLFLVVAYSTQQQSPVVLSQLNANKWSDSKHNSPYFILHLIRYVSVSFSN